MGTPDSATLEKMRTKLAHRKAVLEAFLVEKRDAGVTELRGADQVRFTNMSDDYRAYRDRVDDYAAEVDRCGSLPAGLAAAANRAAGRTRRGLPCASPMSFDQDELRELHAKLMRGESGRIECRDFSSATPLLPAMLYPVPTMPIHESRLADHLSSFAIDAPSLEYVQVNSVTGAAAVVAEGTQKPEIVMDTTQVTIPALKIACHGGVSWESINDWPTFGQYVQQELMARIRDTENSQLLYGTGGSTQLAGMLTQSGIITHDAAGDTASGESALDSVEKAIAALRSGPSLAEPTVFVTSPLTWSALRRIKDSMNRFILSPDPSEDEADTLWGIDVLVSTQVHPGDGVLIDATKMGRICVREVIGLRMGYGVVAGVSDFTANIVRSVVEERLNLATERPSAVCFVKNLPAS
jgi:HK97 family phage major capsid protein